MPHSNNILDREATIRSGPTKSIAVLLTNLEKVFLSKKDPEGTIDLHLTAFAFFVQNHLDELGLSSPQYNEIYEYFKLKFAEPFNEKLDTVEIFIDGKTIKARFPLKKVFSLVCAATLAIDPYQQLEPTKSNEQLEIDRLDRVRTLVENLKDLKNSPVCHHGTRHALVGGLNGVYPAFSTQATTLSRRVYFIEDLDDFFMGIITQELLTIILEFSSVAQFSLLRDWIITNHGEKNSKSEIFINFLIQHKDRIRTKIINSVKEHGFTEEELVRKIIDHLNNLIYLPPLLEVHEATKYLQIILTAQPDDKNVMRTRILNLAKDRLRFCQDWEEFNHEWRMLGEIEEAYQALEKNKFAFCFENGWEEIQRLEALCTRFYDNYIQNQDTHKEDLADARLLYTDFKKRLSQRDFVGFVVNFFSIYAFANPEEKTNLWLRLSTEPIYLFILPDSQIAHLLKMMLVEEGHATSSHPREIELTPEIVNRILLYAILVSPSKWTADFYNLFLLIKTFIQDRLNLDANDPRRTAFAYYRNFSPQFDFLAAVYGYLHSASGESSSVQSSGVAQSVEPSLENYQILLPLNLEGIQGGQLGTLAVLYRHLSLLVLSKESIIEIFHNKFSGVFNLFFNILKGLDQTKTFQFIKLFDIEFLMKTISDGYQLADILSMITNAEDQLAFLDQFSSKFLMKIIEDTLQLGEILTKILGDKIAKLAFVDKFITPEFLFRIRVEDPLRAITSAEDQLSFLDKLSNAPLDLLKRMIRHGYQLDNIFRLIIRAEDRLTFLLKLPHDFLSGLSLNIESLLHLLDMLPRNNDRLALFIEFWKKMMLQDGERYRGELVSVMIKIDVGKRWTFLLEVFGDNFLDTISRIDPQLFDNISKLLAEKDRQIANSIDSSFQIDSVSKTAITSAIEIIEEYKKGIQNDSDNTRYGFFEDFSKKEELTAIKLLIAGLNGKEFSSDIPKDRIIAALKQPLDVLTIIIDQIAEKLGTRSSCIINFLSNYYDKCYSGNPAPSM